MSDYKITGPNCDKCGLPYNYTGDIIGDPGQYVCQCGITPHATSPAPPINPIAVSPALCLGCSKRQAILDDLAQYIQFADAKRYDPRVEVMMEKLGYTWDEGIAGYSKARGIQV